MLNLSYIGFINEEGIRLLHVVRRIEYCNDIYSSYGVYGWYDMRAKVII